MSPTLLAACRRCRTGSAFYAFGWSAYVVVLIAAALAALTFPELLRGTDKDDAIGLLVVVVFVGCPLPLIADAVLTVLLTSLPGAAGKPPMHVALRVFLFCAALVLPLLSTAASVSVARSAVSGVERAPSLPSSSWTLGLPIGVFAIVCCVGGGLMAVMPPGVGGLAMAAAYPAFGVVRVMLGLKLRAAFDELLSRPAVDDAHAHATEPVAGG